MQVKYRTVRSQFRSLIIKSKYPFMIALVMTLTSILKTMIHDVMTCICNRTEQKRREGCVSMNPPQATPLHPDSPFLGGFSKVIPHRIAVEIMESIAFQNPSINVELGCKGVMFGGYVETHPSCCICLVWSHMSFLLSSFCQLFYCQ